MEAAAREAADQIGSAHTEIYLGNITQPRLGLGPEQYERLAADVTVCYHLAAIYDLAAPLELAQKVNVSGTGNILEFCARCERLERLNYMSTAYVGGNRVGVCYEHELELGQTFKNHYESTKFQAEVWVRQAFDRIPITIHRPAIIVGDTTTGRTQKFDGPYYMLRLISVAQRLHAPIPQFGRSQAPFNVVPIDSIVGSVMLASADRQAVGQTFHWVDPDPPTARQALELLSQAYAHRKPSFSMPPALMSLGLHIPAVQRQFSGAPHQAISYLNHPVRFDCRNAQELLARNGASFPSFGDYVEAIVDFFKQHETDPAYVPTHL
jgi:thioester reductase-like protein